MDLKNQDLFINAELTPAQVRDVQRRVSAGELRRIHRGVATALPEDQWPALMRRNKQRLAAALFPGAVVSFRSAFDGMVSDPLTLAYTRSRSVELPGLRIVSYAAAPAAEGDRRYGSLDLFLASEARMFLENLSRSEAGKNAPLEDLEERLTTICESRGEARLRQLRTEAAALAPQINREREAQALSQKIGAILGTREARNLQSATARMVANAIDPERMERFDALIRALRTPALQQIADPAGGGQGLAHFAFLEAYFSNFIEGTEFEIEEAAEIALEGKIVQVRPKDSHDVLGVFKQIVNPAWRFQTMLTTDAIVEQLAERHREMMQARPEMRPGEFKINANVAGNTKFVAPRLARGTLIAGANRLVELEPGLPRALYAMFLVAEVHPFDDGNGRLARLVMNAELSAAKQCRIIVPTLYRETYLDTLRLLTREGDPSGFIKAMSDIQRWTAEIDYAASLPELIRSVRKTNALEKSLVDHHLLWPKLVADEEPEPDTVTARQRGG
jgi:hypothetical protein